MGGDIHYKTDWKHGKNPSLGGWRHLKREKECFFCINEFVNVSFITFIYRTVGSIKILTVLIDFNIKLL